MTAGWRVSLTVAIGWLAVSTAAGAPLTFQFTGTVTQLNTDPTDAFAGAIGFGSSVSGSYTFESLAVDGAADTDTGSYSSAGSPFGLSADISGFPFGTGDLVNIGVANNFAEGVDQYTVFATASDGSFSFSILLQNASGTAFSGDALPLAPPNLAMFSIREFHLIADVDGNQVQIDGAINTLQVAAVPEPGTATLLAAALAFALFSYRSKMDGGER
jgi:hypothetical protein